MSAQSDKIAEAVKEHADLIPRASGSARRHYTMVKKLNAILSATMDCWGEAYRLGAAHGARCGANDELLEAAKLALSVAEAWIHDELDGCGRMLDEALAELEPVRTAIAKATGADQ